MNIPVALTKVLPVEIRKCLDITRVTVNEIRLRSGQELAVRSGLNSYFIGSSGVCDKGNGYIVSEKMLNDIVFNACDRSVYAFSEEISRGSVTLSGGVRIGLCGTTVFENGKIITQKNISSINIRIPHEVKGCAKELIKCYKGKPQSSLIIAPVYSGKTTILRDLSANLYSYFGIRNALVIDERNEISGSSEGRAAFNLPCVDILTGCPKGAAIENIIRSMAPEAVIMDEFFESEIDRIKIVANCGAVIFATAHASGIEQIINRFGKENLQAIFSRYFVLSNTDRIGRLTAAYNSDFKEIEI